MVKFATDIVDARKSLIEGITRIAIKSYGEDTYDDSDIKVYDSQTIQDATVKIANFVNQSREKGLALAKTLREVAHCFLLLVPSL